MEIGNDMVREKYFSTGNEIQLLYDMEVIRQFGKNSIIWEMPKTMFDINMDVLITITE